MAAAVHQKPAEKPVELKARYDGWSTDAKDVDEDNIRCPDHDEDDVRILKNTQRAAFLVSTHTSTQTHTYTPQTCQHLLTFPPVPVCGA
jgi:hypothetical protein